MEKKKTSFAAIVFCLLAGYFTYRFAFYNISLDTRNDFAAHAHKLIALFRSGNFWTGWVSTPHCLWHVTVLFAYGVLQIPLDIAASLVAAGYTVFYYCVLVWAVDRVLSHYKYEVNDVLVAFLCFCFLFEQAITIAWFDVGTAYYGPFSMNPLHSPTQLGVRGFSLLCFCIVIDVLHSFGKEDYKPIFFQGSIVKQRILLAMFLFLSVVMKPTFAESFIPAVAFYMLGVWIYRRFKKDLASAYFKSCLWMLLCAAPALLYMLLQYIVFFALGNGYGDSEGMIFTPMFAVWKLFTENVPLSILFGMAFPLYVILIDLRFFLKEIPGKIALCSYGIGFLEASFLAEDGDRFNHANFMWPYMAGMQLLWTVAFWRFIVLEKRENKTVLQRRLLAVGWILFFVHVFFGYLMYREELGL